MSWSRILPVWPLVAVTTGLFGFQNAWASILLYHLGTLLAAWQTPGSWAKLRLGFRPLWAAAAVPLAILAFFSVRWLLPPLLNEAPEVVWSGIRQRLESIGLSGAGLNLFCLYFVLVHPILEDLAWHGVLADPVRPGRAWWVPSSHDGWFALYHVPVLFCIFPGAWALAGLSFAVLVVSSIRWRETARITGGLQSVILQHAAADGAILGAVLWSGGQWP